MRPTRQRTAAGRERGARLFAAAALTAAGLALGGCREERGPAVNSERLTAADGEELFPSISPDGRFVAYASPAGGDWDLFLLRVEGGEVVELTPDSPADDLHPRFSPDGEAIAFSSSRDGGGIFVMDATGGAARQVSAQGFHPDWSPDGRRIVYSTREPILSPATHTRGSSLRVVDLETGEDRQLFAGDATMPRWSPSGERIAFWGIEGSFRDILTIASDGGGTTLGITRDTELDWCPAWSPDGRWIYFSSDRGGALSLWRVAVHEPSGGVRGDLQEVTRALADEVWHVDFAADGRLGVYAVVRAPTGRPSADTTRKMAVAPAEKGVVLANGLRQADLWLLRLAAE